MANRPTLGQKWDEELLIYLTTKSLISLIGYTREQASDVVVYIILWGGYPIANVILRLAADIAQGQAVMQTFSRLKAEDDSEYYKALEKLEETITRQVDLYSKENGNVHDNGLPFAG